MFQILIEPVLRNFCGLLRKSHFSFSIKIFINNQMVQPWVLLLTHFYAIMKKGSQINALSNSSQCFTGDMWMIFLYSSEKKNTFNYFQITSIRATKILNLLLKKKVTINYLFQTLKYQETKISLSLLFTVNPHLVEYFLILIVSFLGVINSVQY